MFEAKIKHQAKSQSNSLDFNLRLKWLVAIHVIDWTKVYRQLEQCKFHFDGSMMSYTIHLLYNIAAAYQTHNHLHKLDRPYCNAKDRGQFNI